MKHAFSHVTAVAEQFSTPESNPYHILTPIRTLRKTLGLTSNDLMTLQALISFSSKKESQVSTSMTIVFPSNAALIERTNGLDERTIRRCIGRLVDAGLIRRRDSATRKRFPLRYGGVIKDAFGFDLAPLSERQAELTARAEKMLQDRERLRSLRAEALALRVAALQRATEEAEVSFLQEVRNILRRATVRLQDIMALIRQMAAMIGAEARGPEMAVGTPQAQAEVPDHLSGADGQIVRHVESIRLIIKKEGQGADNYSEVAQARQEAAPMEWQDLKNVSAFFPDEPHDTKSTLHIIIQVGSLLRINTERLIGHLKKYGPRELLIALDWILERGEQIRSPEAYLSTLLTSEKNWGANQIAGV